MKGNRVNEINIGLVEVYKIIIKKLTLIILTK